MDGCRVDVEGPRDLADGPGGTQPMSSVILDPIRIWLFFAGLYLFTRRESAMRAGRSIMHCKSLKSLRQERRASTSLMLCMLFPVLLGVAALGCDGIRLSFLHLKVAQTRACRQFALKGAAGRI